MHLCTFYTLHSLIICYFVNSKFVHCLYYLWPKKVYVSVICCYIRCIKDQYQFWFFTVIITVIIIIIIIIIFIIIIIIIVIIIVIIIIIIVIVIIIIIIIILLLLLSLLSYFRFWGFPQPNCLIDEEYAVLKSRKGFVR